jgi:2-desacetyl-2-hydroxyethyl bacteriochlorophyllide A dehydrogenase
MTSITTFSSGSGAVKMKAIIWTAYGPPEVLQLQEIEKPLPKDNEVLIRIHATTVTAGDCESRRLDLPMGLGLLMRLFVGIRKPKNILILGQEFSGEVESVGKNVTSYKPGDQVFGGTGFTKGTYAEYVCLEEEPEEGVLAIKPDNITHQEAAGVTTGGLEALHFIGKAGLLPDQKVLIIGAGGSIGTFGVQLAKNAGADVTVVDHGEKLKMLQSLGADQVIDFTREDFTQKDQNYDVIFDVIGAGRLSRNLRSLKEGGMYLLANPRIGKMIWGNLVSRFGKKNVVFDMSQQTKEDLIQLKDLIEAGKIKTVIDRIMPLEDMVEAHHYVESGLKKGNLIIIIEK